MPKNEVQQKTKWPVAGQQIAWHHANRISKWPGDPLVPQQPLSSPNHRSELGARENPLLAQEMLYDKVQGFYSVLHESMNGTDGLMYCPTRSVSNMMDWIKRETHL